MEQTHPQGHATPVLSISAPMALATGMMSRMGSRRGREGRRAAKLVRLMEATSGFEPLNRGFADLRLGPLGYVAPIAAGVPVRVVWLPLEDSNLGSRIRSPASYH